MPQRPQRLTNAPTAAEVSRSLGVELAPVLSSTQVKRLRRALPGYAAQLDEAVALLAGDADALNVPGQLGEQLAAMRGRHRMLAQAEATLSTAYMSAYHQRLGLDHEAMGLLLMLARRVKSRAEENPELMVRWKTLLDFLGTFRQGGRSASGVDDPEGEGEADEGGAPAPR